MIYSAESKIDLIFVKRTSINSSYQGLFHYCTDAKENYQV